LEGHDPAILWLFFASQRLGVNSMDFVFIDPRMALEYDMGWVGDVGDRMLAAACGGARHGS
jgi:hypothetical protein